MSIVANPPPNALGDERAVFGVPADADDKTVGRLAERAERQTQLRAMIGPRGRRRSYLTHLHDLASETGALLIFYHPNGFVAQWRAETTKMAGWCQIVTPLPFTVSHYLTGLHEFGHVVQWNLGGTSNHAATPEGIYGELMAWVWAFEHCIVEIPRRDYITAENALFHEAVRCGLRGGPVADWMPEHLRQPFRDAMARLTELAQ